MQFINTFFNCKKRLAFSFLFLSLGAFAQTKKTISLDDIFNSSTFKPKSVAGFNALKDGIRYTQIDEKEGRQMINIYNLKDGKLLSTLLDAHQLNPQITFDDYQLSDDEKAIVLMTESQNIYRRSVQSKVYVYTLANQQLQLIDNEKILHAKLSPDGTMIAYVKNNNLYLQNIATHKVIAVTTDGEKNKIINGNCDWVYEEEFGFSQAYQWAPNSNFIAYYRFDESLVPQYNMTIYDSLYPTQYQYKYPKAGEPNAKISIHTYQIASGKKQQMAVNTPTEDSYIPRIIWAKQNNDLCVLKLNRLQNHLDYYIADATTGKTFISYQETNKSYLDIDDNIAFLPNEPAFILSTERDGWNHLYKYNYQSKKLNLLTKGDFDIESLTAVDEKNQKIYYTAAVASPLEKQLYTVDFKGKKAQLITPALGTHVITPCKGFQFFLDKFSTLQTPPVYSLIDQQGNTVRVLEANEQLVHRMNQYDLGCISFKKISLSNGSNLNAWIITPPHFDEHADKKYPLLMYQYSGPNSQEVADRFPIRDFFWHQLLAQKGYVIACVDGIGTGFRGEDFRKKTYLQLGKMESEDQIAAAKYFSHQNYIDSNRIGIWGWSFGGFMSATCIFKGADIFKMAVSVAPVTNWRYYDNIYTERYMRTPLENAKGYDENAPELMTDQLKGKFLLIHGTGDDNVHVQNSMSLINNLIKSGKEYDSEFYPNRAHGISGGNTRYHLYKRITNFILNNL